MGVPQGAVLSLFLFSLRTDSLSPCHSRLLKYANHFVPCTANVPPTANVLTKRGWTTTWSADHGLVINKAKCVCYSKTLLPNSRFLSLMVNMTKYVGENFSSNMTWSAHIDTGFTRYLKQCLFIHRLHFMNVHKSLMANFFSFAIPVILYCFKIMSPDFLTETLLLF